MHLIRVNRCHGGELGVQPTRHAGCNATLVAEWMFWIE